ncbi:MAG: hypothetical protein JWO32_2168 [Bacteroidetes bacterium]|nr:hypothetical protein [Bacteroidota bacterium]
MINFLQKKYANYVLKPYLKWYLKKPRSYYYEGLALKIYPTVFHPGYFFSTHNFLKYIKSINLKGGSFCEVGAGSGLVSMVAARSGARVVAVELNEVAIRGMNENIILNNISDINFEIIHSNLFDRVPQQVFDFIYINPPYFFEKVHNEQSMAWNCGSKGEYFKKLFVQLLHYRNDNSRIYMTLAENCDLTRINSIACEHGFELECVNEARIKWEKNFIFKVNLIKAGEEHG